MVGTWGLPRPLDQPAQNGNARLANNGAAQQPEQIGKRGVNRWRGMALAMVRLSLPAAQSLAHFLRHPRWTRPMGLGSAESWALWRGATGLYLAGLLVLALVLHLWQRAMGLPSPDAFGKVPPALLLPTVTLLAPVAEECVFRGWLSGRPRALALIAGLVVAAAALWTVRDGAAHPVALLLLLLGVLGAALGWFVLRRRETPAWFVAAFPVLFMLHAVVFALFHLSNYPRITLALVPMVLPQLWAGLVFGFIRVRISLPAAMLAHALGNLAAVTVAFLVQ